jgi:hypothetical protein
MASSGRDPSGESSVALFAGESVLSVVWLDFMKDAFAFGSTFAF